MFAEEAKSCGKIADGTIGFFEMQGLQRDAWLDGGVRLWLCSHPLFYRNGRYSHPSVF